MGEGVYVAAVDHTPSCTWRAKIHMTYAIIRGNNGRRHEVDFGDSPVRVEVHASDATVEISSRRILRRFPRSVGVLR
jgi:hypothetical protein